MANSVDQDQTAPIGADSTGPTLFASILNSSVMLGNYLQQTTISDAFFLGASWLKWWCRLDICWVNISRCHVRQFMSISIS